MLKELLFLDERPESVELIQTDQGQRGELRLKRLACGAHHAHKPHIPVVESIVGGQALIFPPA